MTPVFGNGVTEWVRSQLPDYYIPDCQAIGLESDNRIVCGVVYYNKRGHDIELSMAATTARWCNKWNIGMFLHYPFVQLGCERVTSVVDESNLRCRRFLEGIGFIHEGTHPKAMPNKATALSYGLLKEDCRWLS